MIWVAVQCIVAEELKFTQRLKKYPYEYKVNPRIRDLAELLDKDKSDLVYWYETSTEVYVKSKRYSKKKKSYSVKPESKLKCIQESVT